MENKEEVDARVKEFTEGYKNLVEKHKIDYANVPTFIPDGQGAFKLIVQNYPVDISQRPTESPFIPKA